VISLLLFLVYRKAEPIASFYLLHTRFWELGSGVVLGLLPRVSAASHAAEREWVGWQTLVLMGLALSLAISG